MLISALLLAALCAPQDPSSLQDVSVSLVPRSGPDSVVRQGAPYLLRVRNNEDREIAAVVEVWVSPDVSLRGVPCGLRLGRRQLVEFPCNVHVETDRPAGQVQLRIVVRAVDSAERLGQVKLPLHVAVGRDFLRLSFEDKRRSGTVIGDAPHGRGFLRLTGSGSRSLLAPAPAFDTGRFPYLTFWLRNRSKGSAALRLSAGEREVSLPLPAAPRWQRVVVNLQEKLGDSRNPGSRVSAIAICGDLDLDLDLDEFAVVRTCEPTMGDRLRHLTVRHRRDLVPEEVAALQRELHEIDSSVLSGQELVDHELLGHDLQWQQLQGNLPPKRAGRPAGRERFEAMLRHVHHLDPDSAQLCRLGEEQVRIHQQMLDELATRIAPGKSWRQVVELLKRKHPSAAGLAVFAREAMQHALDFTITNSLVTVPHAARHAAIRVVTGGQLSRTYPFGGYGGARPSRTGFTGTYFVSPPADWMDEEQAAERLRGNHYAKTRVVALHEVVPGHHLQSVVHRLRPLSRFRRRFYSTVFGEGWALYCEETMHRSGFFDLETRFAQLQMRLWRAVRVVVDVGLHTGRLTMAGAEQMLVEEAGLDPVNAEAEVLRYVDNPTRPMSYLVGFLMIDDLEAAERRRLGSGFDGRAFRDRLLAFGPVPLPAVLKGMQRERGRQQ